MLEVLIPLFISIVGGIIAKEINAHDWGSALAVKIIDHAVICHLPEAWHSRLKEEWLAEIENIPSDFQKVRYAFSLIAGAGRIKRDYQPVTDRQMMDATEKWTEGEMDEKTFFETIGIWVEQYNNESVLKITRILGLIGAVFVIGVPILSLLVFEVNWLYMAISWFSGLLGFTLSYIRWRALLR